MLHVLVLVWLVATASLAGLLSLVIAVQVVGRAVGRALRAVPRLPVPEKRVPQTH